MLIIQDQREKHGHHNEISNYCKSHEIPLIRKRLEVGDYMLGEIKCGKVVPIGKRSIDTKSGGISELCADLYRDKKEFNKKYRKCYEQGIELYVLVEQEITSLNDILSWSSPHSKISGKMLYDMIDRVRKSYGVKFVFCRKENVAQTIINILCESEKAK
jgi:predicted peroxiredoxin